MTKTKNIRIDFPDEDLQRRVSSFLTNRHYSAFRNIEVGVEHGEVTLTGSVDSYYEKQLAMASCQHVAGVLGLVDEIDVERELVE